MFYQGVFITRNWTDASYRCCYRLLNKRSNLTGNVEVIGGGGSAVKTPSAVQLCVGGIEDFGGDYEFMGHDADVG